MTSIFLVKIKPQKVLRPVRDLDELYQKNGKVPIQTRSTYRGNGPTATKWWREEKQGESWSSEQWIMLECWMHLHKSQGLMSWDNRGEGERKIEEIGRQREGESGKMLRQGNSNPQSHICEPAMTLQGRFSLWRRTDCIFVSVCQTEWQAVDNSPIDN